LREKFFALLQLALVVRLLFSIERAQFVLRLLVPLLVSGAQALPSAILVEDEHRHRGAERNGVDFRRWLAFADLLSDAAISFAERVKTPPSSVIALLVSLTFCDQRCAGFRAAVFEPDAPFLRVPFAFAAAAFASAM